MEIEEALDFVRANHHATLATIRRDGTPQLSPVTLGVARDGKRLVISTTQHTAKTKNLRRDPRAFLAVTTNRFYGPWLQVRGDVELIELPDAMEILVDYYRDISGEHPDWDDYRAAMVRDERLAVLITPTPVVG